ncbi:MAG: MEDS domain-containing protein, partial [candidate division Zixibacteria bacterium]|nr:MEDS domain-containing protein [candidate division Zixibacteria bacterium]
MEEKKRKTGIDIIGDVPWGTHFCQFYQTKEDLIDILVPYFKAGLENNELCLWVTSEPLGEKEAREAMQKAVSDLDQYLKKGQIEIVPYSQWYLKDGVFNLQRVLNAWIDKLNQALAKGYDGLRVTGNTAWLEKRGWENFTQYEEEVNNAIGKYQMISICTYSLDKCGATEVIEVVKNHQFALIKREGKWESIENSERKESEEKIKKIVKEWEMTFDSIQDLVSIQDRDFKLVRVNKACADIFKVKPEELIGRTCYEVFHGVEEPLPYCPHKKSLETKRKAIAEFSNPRFGTELEITASPIFNEKGEVTGSVHIAKDITERKRTEKKLRESEERYRLTLDNMLEGCQVIGFDWRYLYVNDAVAKHGRRAKEELLGYTMMEMYPGIEKTELFAVLRRCMEKRISVRMQSEFIFPDGDKGWFELSIQPVPEGIFILSQDITERK